MYEYDSPVNQNPMGFGIVPDGQSEASGTSLFEQPISIARSCYDHQGEPCSQEQIASICRNLTYNVLTDERWDECRPHVTAEYMCNLHLSSDGEPCSAQEVSSWCAIQSEEHRTRDCAPFIAALETQEQRPGTVEAPSTTFAQTPVSRQNIRTLQNYIIGQGCSVGSSGADGLFGPQTRAGLQCVIDQTGYVNVAGRFSWISTVMVTPTGQARPAGFTFDPGTSAKTPENVVVSGSPGGGGGSVSQPGSTPADIDKVQQAGIFGALPLWGWVLIALGGVGALGVVGVMALGEEEPEFEEEDEKFAYGYGRSNMDGSY